MVGPLIAVLRTLCGSGASQQYVYMCHEYLQEVSAAQALVQGKEGSLCGMTVCGLRMAVQCSILHMQVRGEPVLGPQQLQKLLCRRAP